MKKIFENNVLLDLFFNSVTLLLKQLLNFVFFNISKFTEYKLSKKGGAFEIKIKFLLVVLFIELFAVRDGQLKFEKNVNFVFQKVALLFFFLDFPYHRSQKTKNMQIKQYFLLVTLPVSF